MGGRCCNALSLSKNLNERMEARVDSIEENVVGFFVCFSFSNFFNGQNW